MALLVALPAPLPAWAQSESGQLRVREAAAAIVRGNLDQAIALYNEALDDKSLPNDRRATILNDRGVAYARRQQHKEAIDDFNRAIQLYPEYAAVYNNRGNVLLGLGAVKEAIKDFDRALVLAPGYAAAYSNRAGAYIKLGQVDRALADYSRSIVLTPNSAAALNGRGRAHLAASRPHGAIRDFTRAVSLDARFGAAYRSRAEAKMAIERHEEAIEDYSRAIAFEPRNAEIYALRGWAYMEADNPASGVKDFAKAIELTPNVAAFYAARGFAYAKAEAYEDALNDFARAIELEPRSPTAFAYRAWTYRQQQQPELALRDVERALRLDANCAEAYWARGEINEALGPCRAWRWRTCARRLTLDPRRKAVAQALDRLGAGTRAERVRGRRCRLRALAGLSKGPAVRLHQRGVPAPQDRPGDDGQGPAAHPRMGCQEAAVRGHCACCASMPAWSMGPGARRRSSTRPSSICRPTRWSRWWCSGRATRRPNGLGTTASSSCRAPTA